MHSLVLRPERASSMELVRPMGSGEKVLTSGSWVLNKVLDCLAFCGGCFWPRTAEALYSQCITFTVLWDRSGWQGCLCLSAADHLFELWTYALEPLQHFQFRMSLLSAGPPENSCSDVLWQSIHLQINLRPLLCPSVMDEKVGYMIRTVPRNNLLSFSTV